MLKYPFGADAKDPVTITRGDYNRLDKWEFLNDNLVDWYLKYLYKVRGTGLFFTGGF